MPIIQPHPDINHQELISRLAAIVGHRFVSTAEEDVERHSFDAITSSRLNEDSRLISARVQTVVRPADTNQVSAIVKVASHFKIPVIPYGGGTGIMGGVIPTYGGVAVDLRRMARVLVIDSENRIAKVQSGATLMKVDQAAKRYNLMLGHDPWSTPIATVGGAISTNSIGYRAAKYGSMGQQVRALEVVTSTGDITRTKPLLRQSSGPQINGLFIGSEGTMGIITEATIDLFRIPESRIFVTIGFESFEKGFLAVMKFFDIGLVPALLDLTEEDPIDGSLGFRCVLYMCIEGYTQEVKAQKERTIAECLFHGGHDLGPDLTQSYWNNRHTVAERWRDVIQPLRPTERWTRFDNVHSEYLHLSLPMTKILSYKASAEKLVSGNGLKVKESAIWTNPELFSMIVSDDQSNDRSKLNGVVGTLLDMALEMGGGIEYCHGIGVKLGPWATAEWGRSIFAARSVKNALDPDGIMNPGKLGL